MIFLAVDLAIFERLTGAPLDSQGKPKVDASGVPVNRSVIGPPLRGMLPSYGIQIPEPKHPNDLSNMLTSKDPDAIRIFEKGFDPKGFRQVPVFDENLEARKWADVWPCVSFRWRSHDFDTQTFIYSDPFCAPNKGSVPVQVDGVDGFKQVTRRAEPMGWVMEYVITAYSKTRMELGFICEQLQYLFPPRGGIQVKQMDGSTITIDMLLQRVETVDVGGDELLKSLGPEEQAYFARAYVFKVEAYQDNTANKFGSRDLFDTPVVLQRILELQQLQNASYSIVATLDH